MYQRSTQRNSIRPLLELIRDLITRLQKTCEASGPETDLWEASGIVFQDADKSQLALAESPASDRIAFALCLLETGLRMYPPEKSWAFTAFTSEQSVLCSPVYLRIITKYGHYSRISAQIERKSSAVETCWRRECDSNLRYLFEFVSPDVVVTCSE